MPLSTSGYFGSIGLESVPVSLLSSSSDPPSTVPIFTSNKLTSAGCTSSCQAQASGALVFRFLT